VIIWTVRELFREK